MQKISEQQIRERYATLPTAIKNVVTADETDVALYKIATQRGLAEDDAILFAQLAHMILVGLVPIAEAAEYISNTLDLKRPLAEVLTGALRDEIISKYKTDYDKLVGMKDGPSRPVENGSGKWREFITKNLDNDKV